MQLPHAQLQALAAELIHIMYQDIRTEDVFDDFCAEAGLNPDKEWEAADVCQDLATMLDEHNLIPTEFEPYGEEETEAS
jgi:hypothetical protein